MRKIIFLLLLVVSTPALAQSSDKLPILFVPEMFGQIGQNDNGAIHNFSVSAFGSSSFSKRYPVLGVGGFALLNTQGSDVSAWVEAMIGPRLRVAKGNVEFGCLFGGEYFQSYDTLANGSLSVSDVTGFRYSPYFTAMTNNQRFFCLVVFEFGEHFVPGERNQALRAELWTTVTNPDKNTRLRLGAFGYGDYVGPAAKVVVRFMYIFVAPYMWNTNLSNESIQPHKTYLSNIGLGIELAQ